MSKTRTETDTFVYAVGHERFTLLSRTTFLFLSFALAPRRSSCYPLAHRNCLEASAKS